MCLMRFDRHPPPSPSQRPQYVNGALAASYLHHFRHLKGRPPCGWGILLLQTLSPRLPGALCYVLPQGFTTRLSPGIFPQPLFPATVH